MRNYSSNHSRLFQLLSVLTVGYFFYLFLFYENKRPSEVGLKQGKSVLPKMKSSQSSLLMALGGEGSPSVTQSPICLPAMHPFVDSLAENVALGSEYWTRVERLRLPSPLPEGLREKFWSKANLQVALSGGTEKAWKLLYDNLLDRLWNRTFYKKSSVAGEMQRRLIELGINGIKYFNLNMRSQGAAMGQYVDADQGIFLNAELGPLGDLWIRELLHELFHYGAHMLQLSAKTPNIMLRATDEVMRDVTYLTSQIVSYLYHQERSADSEEVASGERMEIAVTKKVLRRAFEVEMAKAPLEFGRAEESGMLLMLAYYRMAATLKKQSDLMLPFRIDSIQDMSDYVGTFLKSNKRMLEYQLLLRVVAQGGELSSEEQELFERYNFAASHYGTEGEASVLYINKEDKNYPASFSSPAARLIYDFNHFIEYVVEMYPHLSDYQVFTEIAPCLAGLHPSFLDAFAPEWSEYTRSAIAGIELGFNERASDSFDNRLVSNKMR